MLLIIGGEHATSSGAASGIIAVLSGALLVVGFFTSAVSFAISVLCACALSSVLPGTLMFDSRMAAFLAGAIGIAIVLLGPGAFSADARLFGPREIIIPAATGFRDGAGTNSNE